MLVDTSVWIDHFRQGELGLARALEVGAVWTHPFILGELACGNLRARDQLLSLLQALPMVVTASDSEVLFFIEKHRLMGRGVGYVDAHLLAAARLAGVQVWTRDKRLRLVAEELGLAHPDSLH